jgi:hypothetical protein
MTRPIIFLMIFVGLTTTQSASAGNATLFWSSNMEPDLAGYNVYYGPSSSAYTDVINVGLTGSPDSPSYTINALADGQTYYFAIAAYDSFGNQSSFSQEVSKFIPPLPEPVPPSSSGGGGCAMMIKDVSSGSKHSRDKIPLDLLILTLLLLWPKICQMRWIYRSKGPASN